MKPGDRGPEASQAVDEIVDRADAAGLGVFVPKSYREERAARTGAVPLLEYLDKLEATAMAATDGRWAEVNDWTSTKSDAPYDTIEVVRAPKSDAERSSWPGEVHAIIAQLGENTDNPDADRAHILATQPRATLALIARLRKYHKALAELCNNMALNSEDPDDTADIRALLLEPIEVPS